jgi:parallel beta-helix repeat protein
MRPLHGRLGSIVVLAAALTGGRLHAQAQQVTTCGTTIRGPGNYTLAADIGPCSGDGVTITASDVTFDLAGHTISGISTPASCNTGEPQIGITVTTGASNVQIGGGTVTGFVDGIAFGASDSRVASMRVANNCINGMVVSNATSVTVDASTVTGNGSDGLLLLDADASSVQANDVSSNGRYGVALVAGSDRNTIRDNSLKGNGGGGLVLIGGTDTRILRNLAQGNLQGIALHTGDNVVEGNIAGANQTVGITIAEDGAGHNRLTGNTATGNGAFDLTDVNANCGTNLWQDGIFVTDDVAGQSDDGPGAGCITGKTALTCTDGACSSEDKAFLLAQTGAMDQTGPLPELGLLEGPVTVGEVTLEGAGVFVGDASVAGDGTPLLSGSVIALTDPQSVLSVAFPDPVFTAGFDFADSEAGTAAAAGVSATTFLLTLEREGVSVRQLAFSAPSEAAAFVNVVSEVGFDKMVLSTLADFRRDDVAFGVKMLGNMYAGRTPVFVRRYDVLVLGKLQGVRGVLHKVSPGDGVFTTLSDFGDGRQGIPGARPSDVAVERSRQILVVDPEAGTNNRGSLSRIDPNNGLRTPIHDFGNPGQASQGTPLGVNPVGLAVEPTGHILVVDDGGVTAGGGGEGRLFRVNPSTNVRTILNDFGKSSEGPLVPHPIDVAVEPSGRILVLDKDAGTHLRGALFRIDPTTRKRTVLSDFGDPAQGAPGTSPTSIAVEASGTILVICDRNGDGRLYRIDPKNGFRTEISHFDNPAQGPTGEFPFDVAVTPDGGILVVDIAHTALFLVDPVTGFRIRLTDSVPAPFRIAILPY